MKQTRYSTFAAVWIGLLFLIHLTAQAQAPVSCAWPLKTDGKGISNIAYPDTNATYWTMPIDTELWKTVIVQGTYPNARFFSYVTYNSKGQVSDVAVPTLHDVEVAPDAGSANPFTSSPAKGQPQRYTIAVDVDKEVSGGGGNVMQFSSTSGLGFLIYRVYVPKQGLDETGGAGLPSLTLVSRAGVRFPVSPCSRPSEAPSFPKLGGTCGALDGQLLRHG